MRARVSVLLYFCCYTIRTLLQISPFSLFHASKREKGVRGMRACSVYILKLFLHRYILLMIKM